MHRGLDRDPLDAILGVCNSCYLEPAFDPLHRLKVVSHGDHATPLPPFPRGWMFIEAKGERGGWFNFDREPWWKEAVEGCDTDTQREREEIYGDQKL